MPPEVFTVVASLIVMAVIGFALGWYASRHNDKAASLDRDALQQRELEHLRLQLDELEAKQREQAATDALHDSELAQRDSELGTRQVDLEGREADLQQRESELSEREAAMTLREANLGQDGSELAEELRQQIESMRARPPGDSDEAELAARLAVAHEELEATRQELELRTGQVLGLRDQLASVEARLERSPRPADADPEQIARLVAQIEERDRETERLQGVAEAALADLKEMEKDLAQAREQLSLVPAQGQASVDQATRVDQRVQELEALTRRLNDQLEARQSTIERSGSELSDLEESYVSQLLERDERIRELEAAQTETAREHQRHGKRAQALQIEIERLTSALEDRQRDTVALEEALVLRGEQVTSVGRELEELAASYERQIAERDAEVERLRYELEARAARIDQAHSERDAAKSDLDGLAADLEAHRRARAALQTTNEEADALTAQLQAQLTERNSTLERARHDARELDQGYTHQIEQFQAHIDELEERTAAAARSATDLRARLRERDQTIEQMEQTRHERERAHTEGFERTTELEQEISRLRTEANFESAAASATIQQQLERVEELEGHASRQESEIATLQQRADGARTERDRMVAELRQVQEASKLRLRERDLESKRLSDVLRTRELELHASADQVAQLEATASELEQQQGLAAAALSTLEARVEAMEAELNAARAETDRQVLTIESLRSDLAEAEGAHERRLRAGQLENERVNALLSSREGELLLLRAELESVAEDMQGAETRLVRRQARVDELEHELQRSYRVRERVLRELHEREQETRLLRRKMAVEPTPADDLTVIRGIGTVTAQALEEIGLATYRQIAALVPRDVEWIEERIPALRGRVRAEQWAEDATAAHLDKYGQSEE